ncbi:LuxR C-terminal-related transcriptional regulator [Rariglobus hedericola]|uniref:LuxR C-terminal-related transcriptional regulator n=1 Tax=Rariglobus hedericola TaxID=2597822 RepID=UPI00139688B5|nr:response regulator transcription factor [Rariglobus hedericola]
MDDHAAIIGMMTQVVESLPGFKVVGSALDADAAMEVCRNEQADIIILDLVLPGVSGLALLGELGIICPKSRILIFTGSLNAAAMRGALAAGVLSVVEKMATLEIFRAALLSVSQGQTYFGPLAGNFIKALVSRDQSTPEANAGISELTKREKTVLCHVAQGLSSKEIADKLGVSVHTVINHRSNLMKKTGLHRVAQLSLFAVQAGLVGETTDR